MRRSMLDFTMSPRQRSLIVAALEALNVDALTDEQRAAINAEARAILEDDDLTNEARTLAEMMREAEAGALNALCI